MKRIATALLAASLVLVPLAMAQQPDRGWQAIVSESREGAYLGTRYAPAVRVGSQLLLSGVIGVSRDGDNGATAQFRRAFTRLSEILAEQGLSLADVAEMTTYHVNLGELGRDFIAVKNEFLPEPPYPAWTAIGVERLFLDSALIEIRATVAIPAGHRLSAPN